MSHFDSNANWYLIQTKPRQEARAQEHLLRQQYDCFRPLKPKVAASAPRSRRALDEDLFPGYVFIRLDTQESWYPIRSTRGVCRIVAFGGQPCPVPDALIAQIRQRLEQTTVAPASSPFSEGEAVRVRAGNSELQAIFLCDDGDERAVILLTLLQREQRISLPRSSLQRIAAHAC